MLLTHTQALDERNTERIAVEKNAQRLCERIRVEAQNSAKMLGTDNTKLQSELLELKGKLAECEKSIVGYVSPLFYAHCLAANDQRRHKKPPSLMAC